LDENTPPRSASLIFWSLFRKPCGRDNRDHELAFIFSPLIFFIMTENQKESCLTDEERAQLRQLTLAVNRILQLQRIDDFSIGEQLLFRSTQSNTCSSASTGGCHIEGKLTTASPAS
jgi:hypothetical protein